MQTSYYIYTSCNFPATRTTRPTATGTAAVASAPGHKNVLSVDPSRRRDDSGDSDSDDTDDGMLRDANGAEAGDGGTKTLPPFASGVGDGGGDPAAAAAPLGGDGPVARASCSERRCSAA
jgi:hypothetical protein